MALTDEASWVALVVEGFWLGSSPRREPAEPTCEPESMEVWLGSDLAKPGVNENDASAAAIVAVRTIERMFSRLLD
jgi:hypothetical protein